MFRHPKYYKELRKRNKELQAATRDLAGAHSDQAISTDRSRDKSSVTPIERAPGPGPKQQAIEETVPHNDIEEAQASSNKLKEPQATSDKHQAPSSKHQA